MFISTAYAQDSEMTATIEVPAPMDGPAGAPPDAAGAVAWNIGLIVLMVVLFYVLLIRPQQKRFKEHQDMIGALKKGDKVVTSGGLIGKVEQIKEGSDEVVIDLGDVKVTALKNTIQSMAEKK